MNPARPSSRSTIRSACTAASSSRSSASVASSWESKCPKCGKVFVHPRRVCGECYVEMKEFVEVGPGGVIGTFTILRYAFIDPETGEQKPVPYGYGFIKLDGADTYLQHYIDLQDEKKVKIGARVEPVFAQEKKGTIKDILYFKVVD